MFKRVGILMMALASLGALVPATAAAAERGREDARVVVQKRIVVRHHRPRRAQTVVVKRVEVRNAAHNWR